MNNDLNETGCRNLAIAIIAQAFYDAGSSNVELRQEAFEWIRSIEAKHLADMCGFELNQSYKFVTMACGRAREIVDFRRRSAEKAARRRKKNMKKRGANV